MDDAVISALKRRAARHNRSLEAELRDILQRAAAEEQDLGAQGGHLRLKTVAVNPKSDFGRDDIYGDDG